jgi:hypothetical protein
MIGYIGVSASPIDGGMGFLSFHQPAVTASWGGGSVLVLWTLFVQVAAPAPHTAGRLPTVNPDVAKLLAALALRKAIMNSICLYSDGNMAESCQSEISWDFAALGKVMRNSVRLLFWVPSDSDRRVDFCLTLIMSKPTFINPSEIPCVRGS